MNDFVSSLGIQDQAAGLRELFGPQTAKTFCLASTLDADCTALLGTGTAHALANAGHRTLLIDEVPLSERRELRGFAYPVRYDLGQVLSGFVHLNQALRKVSDRLRYGIGTRVRKAYNAHQVSPPALNVRLLAAQIDIDFMLVITRNPHPGALALYAEDIRSIIVTGLEPPCHKRSLELLRDQAVLQPHLAQPILIVGGQQETQGQAAFERLKLDAQAALGIEIQHVGWIPAAALGNMDTRMMLPASLYRALAGAVSTMEYA